MEDKKHRNLAILVVLILVAACSFVVGKHLGTKKQAWRTAVAAHHAAVDHCRALGKEANRRVIMASRSGMPFAEFNKQFRKTVPADQGSFPEANEDTTHVYTHEPSHRIFYFRFENGVLRRMSSNHGADDIQPHLPLIEKRLAARK